MPSERKYSCICRECKKEFQPDDPYTEICGDKCKEERSSRENKERIEREIHRILPKKYWDIESDRSTDGVKDKSFFLWGNIGAGKSVYMATLAKKYIREHVDVDWISYSKFIMRIQNAYRNKEESPFKIAEAMASSYGVLCIDDLGAEKLTDFVRQITYFIINEREERCLVTLITSNFSLADIDTQIDPRVSSRIAGMCKVLKFSGKDRRINNAK